MQPAQFWIDTLNLQTHREGGFYRETYRSTEQIPTKGLPDRFASPRSFSTAIFFLLRSQDRSLFHRIRSDELWHYYAGTPLTLYILNPDGLKILRLGPNPAQGESFQVVIPANHWFGAKVEQSNSYTLSGCTVAPGFDFMDFELADRKSLIKQFPSHHEVITMLT